MKGTRNVNTIDNGYLLGLLKAKRKELLSTISSRDEILIEPTADEMDSLQQQLSRDIAVRNLDRTSRLLRDIQKALIRMDAKTYGACLSCDEPIPVRRLMVLPWASCCVSCQEAIDSQQAKSDHSSFTMDLCA
jgi:DnaK suppressor protein